MQRAELLFNRHMSIWKRILDIVGSLLGLIILSPLLLMIAVLVKITSPGPILFKQERIGYLEEPIILWKFRTMNIHADSTIHQQHLQNLINSDSPMIKLDGSHDPRITPVGKILRKFGLDELPQLVNVLRGEMSLVGPRPDPLYAMEYYSSWQRRRFHVLPGITGLWQVSGKNNNTFKEMIELDLKYANHMSLFLDIKILILTVPVIICQSKKISKETV